MTAYVAALEAAGVAVERLGPLAAFPDSVFVEDPALVFPEGAIVLRPGAAARFGEAAEIAPVLRRRFGVVFELPPPGFADGGDVLVTPSAVMIGLSARTDRTGAEALVAILGKLGRHGVIVTTPPGVLHFKSDCSLLDEETMLATRRLAVSGVFAGMRVLLDAGWRRGCAPTPCASTSAFSLAPTFRRRPRCSNAKATPSSGWRLARSARSMPACPACRCAGTPPDREPHAVRYDLA